jgi:hypothetical protein
LEGTLSWVEFRHLIAPLAYAQSFDSLAFANESPPQIPVLALA